MPAPGLVYTALLNPAVPSPLVQENREQRQPSSPRGSPGPEAELAGSGTYMRFDVPRPKIKRSWPSFRGEWWARGVGQMMGEPELWGGSSPRLERDF